MVELCRRHGIHLLAYGTLAGGFLSRRYLGRRDPPLVARLERRPGEKESRYRHLLGEAQQAPRTEPIDRAPDEPERRPDLEDRVAALEAEVERLRSTVDRLGAALSEYL